MVRKRKYDKVIEFGKIRIVYHKGIEEHILKHENVSLTEAKRALEEHDFIIVHLTGKDYAFIAKDPVSGKHITIFVEKLAGSEFRLKTIRLSNQKEKKYYKKKREG